MTELLAVGAIAAAGSSVTVIGVWSWLRLSPRRRSHNASRADFSTDFSIERYEPMARLLGDADLEFLTRAQGAEAAARWSRSRRRIFRLYLKDLASDFHSLHSEARALVAESPEQYSELVGILMRQQATFLRAMAAAEIRLALSWAGIGRVDARKLIRVIEAMRLEIEWSVNTASATA
jgi:hypothetical protein